MKTTWRVTKVTETEGAVKAELARVEWFRSIDGADPEDWPTGIGEVEPGEDGAEFIDAGDTMTLDISGEDDAELHAGDDIILELSAVVSVES